MHVSAVYSEATQMGRPLPKITYEVKASHGPAPLAATWILPIPTLASIPANAALGKSLSPVSVKS